MKSVLRKLIIAGLCLLFVSPAFAADQSRGVGIKVRIKATENVNAPVVEEINLYGESHALVIGIDKYTQGWPRLSKAVNDAELVADELRKREFDVTFKKNLNSSELKQTFEEFFILKGENPQARLFVWFAGHGHTLDGEGFLIPADAPRPDKGARFKLKALSMRRFGEFVRLAKSKHAFAVFDSCFSGTIFDTQRSAPPAAITRATTLPVRQFLASGDANQTVSDDGRFRKMFIRALRGEERADANGDGYLTGSEMGMFLTDRITNLTQARQTPRYGKLRDENYDRGDFVFLLARSETIVEKPSVPEIEKPASTVPNNQQSSMELAFWQSIQNSSTPTLFESYLNKFPNGTFVDIAKIKIEELKPQKKVASLAPEVTKIEKPKISKPKLFVETEPKNARVRILNIKPKFHQGIELDAGRYHVEVSASGFETQKKWVVLTNDEDKNLTIRLKKRSQQKAPKYASISPSVTDVKIVARDAHFEKYANGIVHDTKTGLEWYAGLDINRDWDKAKRWVANLDVAGGGWRMPTSKELKSLYKKGAGSRNMTSLLKTTGWWVWSGDTSGSSSAWFFYFKGGHENWDLRTYSYGRRGFAVRSRKQIALTQPVTRHSKKIKNSLGMAFVYIAPGTFIMGNQSREIDRYDGMKQHRVTLTRGFYIQTTEVTQGQWKAVMGSNPSHFKGDGLPVEQVSWNDAQEFIRKLNQREGGKKYRLPTEAEWEYACRAGTTTRFYFGDSEGKFGEYAWCDDNSGNRTHSVAKKKPNAWGLYDMHGNVWEWCQDWYGDYPSGSVTDPNGPSIGAGRVSRGGSWRDRPGSAVSAYHRWRDPDSRDNFLGFRLLREHSEKATKTAIKPNVIKQDDRFVAYDNGTVKDIKTGLMWAVKDNGEKINWHDAKRYCENYRGGGYTDWRLPTQDELAGLYDRSKSYQATKSNNVHLTELIELSTGYPWASETRGPDAAYFHFNNGYRYWIGQSYSYHDGSALPVR